MYAVGIPISNPNSAATVAAIVNYILMKSITKLPHQYAFNFIPEMTYKCLSPYILSTTR
jgi:hypothetical protein